MYLPKKTFASIVAHTPLVSIDLIVRNTSGEILLGKRKNCPAQGFWFVPGGRILKDEMICTAFSRLTEEELGISCGIDRANFVGVYEHFYGDNFSGNDFSTHYVVLGYEFGLDMDLTFPHRQHDGYCWLRPAELLQNPQVHGNTKAYFIERSLLTGAFDDDVL